eukprot:m.1023176 g.1023176  ORF g.1023176 m.1023176 type:complete len:615 (+) comp24096_c1_seq28:1180-3024(+)
MRILHTVSVAARLLAKRPQIFDAVLNRIPFTVSIRRWITSTSACNDTDSNASFNTGIVVRNSISKQKEPLLTRTPDLLTWYQCGPTVYDSAHIGHACTYVRFDIIRRLLQDHFGIHVVQAQGVTDVDDKIIGKSLALKGRLSPRDVARTYEREFAEQMRLLNVLAPTRLLRVTEHLKHIVDFIAAIEAHGHAYLSGDTVYFDTQAFDSSPSGIHVYGKLQPKRQHHGHASCAHGAATCGEVAADEQHGVKRSAADFALWKLAKQGEPAWDSPWGAGRPGWHIECSTMASEVFGATLDLHTGGQDLAFPHHENEMAQSESYHGVAQWGSCYLHSGHVLLGDTKMSKSLGNVISIQALLDRHSADELRMLCLSTKYHQSFSFSDGTMATATRTLFRLLDCLHTCVAYVTRGHDPSAPAAGAVGEAFGQREHQLTHAIVRAKHSCGERFRDDFDTPGALSAMLALVADTNRYLAGSTAEGSTGAVLSAAKCIRDFLTVLGFETQLQTQYQLPLTTWETDTRDADHPAPPSAVAHDGTIDALVAFRSKVRTCALHSLQRAKRETRTTPGASERGGEDGTDLAKSILRECDAVRDALATQSPACVVRDTKDGASSWHVR